MLYYVLTYFFIIVCFLSGLVSSRGRTVCACHLHTMRDSPLSHIKQSQLRLLRATIVGKKRKMPIMIFWSYSDHRAVAWEMPIERKRSGMCVSE